MAPTDHSSFSSPEDEDLFDFPDTTASATPGGVDADASPSPAESQAKPAQKTQQEPEVEAVPVVQQPTPTTAPPTTAPQAIEAESGPLDADLDEDLFDFDTIFLGADGKPAHVKKAEEALPALDNVEPLLEDGPPPPLPSQTQPKAPSTMSETYAPDPSPAAAEPIAPESLENVAPRRRRRRTDHLQEVAEAPVAQVALPDGDVLVPAGLQEGKRGRLIELLALGFLVGNLALILFAWRAGDDFQATLVHVTGTITDAIANGQAQAGARNDSVEPPPPVQPVDPDPVVDQAPDGVETDPIPTPILGPVTEIDISRTSLELARAKLVAGEFEAARRALFRLLANQDKGLLPREITAEAEILIARSFSLQGQALRGAGR